MQRISVLIIDDDDSSRKSLANYLRDVASFDVQDFANGQNAFDFMHSKEAIFQVALLDWQIDNQSLKGPQILEKLSAQFPEIPVIVITGFASDVGARALSLGAYRHLLKPVNLTELVADIRNLAQQEGALRSLVRSARILLQADLCIVRRFDRAKDEYIFAIQDARAPSGVVMNTRSIKAPVVAQILKNEQPVCIQRSHDTGSELWDVVGIDDWVTVVLLPIVYHGRMTGLVQAYTCEYYAFPSDSPVDFRQILVAFATQAAATLYRGDLLRRNQILLEINRLLGEAYDLDGILSLVFSKGMELTNAEAASLYIIDHLSSTSTVRQVAVHGAGMPGTLDSSSRLLKRVLIDGSAQIVDDVQASNDLEESLLNGISGAGLRCVVVFPLRHESRTIGVLVIGSKLPAAFTDDDVSMLQSFAQMATVAVNHAKLVRYQQLLSQPVAKVQGGWAQSVVDALLDLTGKGVSLWLLDNKRNELEIAACRGLSETYQKRSTIPLDRPSSALKALDSGEPQNISDISDPNSAPQFRFRDELRNEGWRAVLIVPLLGSEKSYLGTLHVYSRFAGSFKSTEVELVRSIANQVARALDQQRVSESQRFSAEISRKLAMTASLNVGEVLRSILMAALELTGTESGVVHIVDEEGKTIVNSYCFPETLLQSTPRISSKGYTHKIIQTKRYHKSENAQADRNVNPDTKRSGIKSFVGVPLLLEKSRVVGVLYVNEHSVSRKFGEAEIALLHSLADQAAVAIERARVFREEQTLRRQAQRLQQVASAVTASAALGDITHEILQSLKEIVGYDRATMLLTNGDSRTVVGFDGYEPGSLDSDLSMSPISTDPLVSRAINKRAPLILSETEKDPDWGIHPGTREVKSWACIPLFYEDKPIGLITLDHFEAGHYRSQISGLLTPFGHQAAIAIHDSRILAELERRVKAHEALHIVGRTLSGIRQIDHVFTQLASAVSGTLRCTHCAVFEVTNAELVVRAVSSEQGLSPGRTFKVGEGIAGWVAQNGVSALVCNSLSDNRFEPGWSTFIPQSLIVVPILADGQIIAVVSAESDITEGFDSYDLQFIETMASQASQTVENIALLKRVEEQRVRELEVLQNLGIRLAQLS